MAAGVVDAASVVSLAVFRRQLAVAGTGGEDDGFGVDFGAVVQREHLVRAAMAVAVDIAFEARDGAGVAECRAELAGLQDRLLGQFVATDAGGEAEIVLDLRAGPRLSAGRVLVDHEGVEPFAGPVDRRGQSGRTTADNDQVVAVFELRPKPDFLGDQLDVRLATNAVPADQDRQLVAPDAEPFEQCGRLLVVFRVAEADGNLIPLQEVADLVGVVAARSCR